MPIWFEATVAKEPSADVEYETAYDYQDENGNIVPLAFVLVKGETVDAWKFFLSHLRTHMINRDCVGLISDHHESIISVVGYDEAWQYPRDIHMFYIRHIASNFLRIFKAPNMQKMIVNIGYSRTMYEFYLHYQRLCERGVAYKQWINNIPRSQYALVYDEGPRWGHMETNLVVLKGAHNLPITTLDKTTFYRLNSLFTRKRAEAEARITAAENIQDNFFDRQNEVFEVREMPIDLEFAVNLHLQRCGPNSLSSYLSLLCKSAPGLKTL
ncbi:hypothetical protein Ahy_A09g042618 [Arachis hypogaea]|uniref:MULE transposase domain-containing protein n=1 Tax=Arachis hypogaea TaxID=3818 RepID=A0A445BGD3_ARAHY|nr:hypothetical protein Ahy_A09g042618 [Arachis hypogaea]